MSRARFRAERIAKKALLDERRRGPNWSAGDGDSWWWASLKALFIALTLVVIYAGAFMAEVVVLIVAVTAKIAWEVFTAPRRR